jgi:hypothetical protein
VSSTAQSHFCLCFISLLTEGPGHQPFAGSPSEESSEGKKGKEKTAKADDTSILNYHLSLIFYFADDTLFLIAGNMRNTLVKEQLYV